MERALRDGIQLSEAVTGEGGRYLSPCLWVGARRHREAHRLSLREWPDTGMAEDEEPELSARLNALISNVRDGKMLGA
jgi:hypothetical protein